MLHRAMRDEGIKNIYQLALMAGVSPSILYKFCKGRTNRFYGHTQERLAKVLPNLFGPVRLSIAGLDYKTDLIKMETRLVILLKEIVELRSKIREVRLKRLVRNKTTMAERNLGKRKLEVKSQQIH